MLPFFEVFTKNNPLSIDALLSENTEGVREQSIILIKVEQIKFNTQSSASNFPHSNQFPPAVLAKAHACF
jgi:hypothetical protein